MPLATASMVSRWGTTALVGRTSISSAPPVISFSFGAQFSVMKRCAQSPGAELACTLMVLASATVTPSPSVSATAAAVPDLMIACMLMLSSLACGRRIGALPARLTSD